MTLLVRDEQDIIRENIEFHLAQGVDLLIATDNRSVDATTSILKEYESRGLLHYISETRDDYNQRAWVTRMARMAYSEYGADWVINSDADEFWWPLEENLKETFKNLPDEVNVLRADRHNFVVVGDSDEPFWSRMVYREKNSLNALGGTLPPKVAHRGAATVRVSQGNHSVEGMGTLNMVKGPIEILHFPIRGYKQIENKIALGGTAYARNRELPESDGRTWRKLYEDYQTQGSLKQYFEAQYHDVHRLEERTNAGEIFIDTKLRDLFNAA
ncbi:glycosyltransferase family 2 protein [Pseudomonadota bacterium]